MDSLSINGTLSFTGSQLNAYIQKLGWTIDPSTSVVAIPPNPDNQIEATIVQESVKLPRTSIFPYFRVCWNPSYRARKGYCTLCRKNIALYSPDNNYLVLFITSSKCLSTQNVHCRILLHSRSQHYHRYQSSWIEWQGEYVVYALELVPQSSSCYENYIIGCFSSGRIRIDSSTIRPEHVWLSWKVTCTCILPGATSCIRNLAGRADILRVSIRTVVASNRKVHLLPYVFACPQ